MLDEATTRTFASMISVMPQHNPILQMRRQRLRKVSGGKKKKKSGSSDSKSHILSLLPSRASYPTKKGCGLFCLLLGSQHLEECLACTQHSNVFPVNGYSRQLGGVIQPDAPLLSLGIQDSARGRDLFKVTLRLWTTDSTIFSLPGSPSPLSDLSRPKTLGAPETPSKATLMGSWRRASPKFITLSKVGAERCQAKPQKRPAAGKQGPACQQSERAGPAFKSPLHTNA